MQLDIIPRGLVAAVSKDSHVSYARTWRAVRADNFGHLSPAEENAIRLSLLRRTQAEAEAAELTESATA